MEDLGDSDFECWHGEGASNYEETRHMQPALCQRCRDAKWRQGNRVQPSCGRGSRTNRTAAMTECPSAPPLIRAMPRGPETTRSAIGYLAFAFAHQCRSCPSCPSCTTHHGHALHNPSYRTDVPDSAPPQVRVPTHMHSGHTAVTECDAKFGCLCSLFRPAGQRIMSPCRRLVGTWKC